ncbi:choice-of-anchor tandem repeat GloVer-containing protein [Segetibacter koreensis]|uniref:choice-of-anchor tandem repeat GloVer-containing protein n=1 Tax=Segetibacter koreensis TaxID=398037 RepID=UPI000373C0C6|nr:choice-of-anchor tandem repeat GloVer-containing protein [Segetibacter koreensis]
MKVTPSSNRNPGQHLSSPIRFTSIFNRKAGYSFKKYYSLLFLIALVFFTILSIRAQDVLVGLTSVGGPQGGGTAFTINSNGSSFSVKKSFLRLGISPKGNLIKATDGNFYGMTSDGGAYAAGTIFKMTSAGAVTIVHHFNSFDGNAPEGSLLQASDGNFYGMTPSESNNKGTIFKLTSAGVFTVIKYLSSDAYRPFGNLIQAPDGNLYGMTYYGGVRNLGTVFKITSSGSLTVLHSFNGSTDGSYPTGSLARGDDGNFYGMTTNGGSSSFYGTIFKITPTGTFTVLKSFNNTNGATPYGSLVKNTDGTFYGITSAGGTNGAGTIFKITSTGTFTLLRNLDYSKDGGTCRGSLVHGSDGNFYGTTGSGGNYFSGTIFKVTTSGNLTVLRHLSQDKDGVNPNSLVQGNDGFFYGLANTGGIQSNGTIFKMSSTGSFSVLVSLPGTDKGGSAHGSLVQGQDGLYYSMTTDGGLYRTGTIFKLCTDGSYSVLRSFNDSYATEKFDGGQPHGNLIQGKDGSFYGLTSHGGVNGYGTFFKVSSVGSFTVLYSFDGNDKGGSPYGSLVQGTDGNFYGMTESGGANISGVIFKATSAGAITVLHSFDYNADGAAPRGSLVRGSDGNFYGLTALGGVYNQGTIFKITPSGTFTKLHSFEFRADGAFPYGSLVQGNDGNFYGLTTKGGTNQNGTIFKCTPSGTYTVLRHLYSGNDGGSPNGSLVKGSDGSFYGLNSVGGKKDGGTIFKITSGGTYTLLRDLDKATDGGTALGNLIIRKANPVANAQSLTTNANTAETITLTGQSEIPLVYTITTAPKNGTLKGTGPAKTYTPKADYAGKDSFYFTVSWGCQTSAPAKVNITVRSTSAAITAHTTATDEKDVNLQEALKATLYPNPVHETMTLSINRPLMRAVISIINVSGAVLSVSKYDALGSNKLEIPVNQLKQGEYFLRLQTGDTVTAIKFLKM